MCDDGVGDVGEGADGELIGLCGERLGDFGGEQPGSREDYAHGDIDKDLGYNLMVETGLTQGPPSRPLQHCLHLPNRLNQVLNPRTNGIEIDNHQPHRLQQLPPLRLRTFHARNHR